jgi:hypothetical protein
MGMHETTFDTTRARMLLIASRTPVRFVSIRLGVNVKALLLILAVALLVACGSAPSSNTATPTPTLTQAQLGAEYLALVAPANAATSKLAALLQPAQIDAVQVRAAALELENAEVTLNSNFLAFSQKVPVAVQPDVAAARLAVSNDIAVLQTVVATKTDADLTSALSAWVVDVNAESKAFVLLRSDLGLPPPS